MSNDEIYEMMGKLGLSKNEIKIYLTLIRHGSLSPREISSLSQVPMTKIYLYLNKLEREGWIRRSRSYPNTFTAKPPKDAIKDTLDKFIKKYELYADKLMRVLQPIYEERGIAEKPDIWILKGYNNVLNKIIDIINNAKKEILLALHTPLIEIVPFLKQIWKKGVNIRILTKFSDEIESVIKGLGDIRYRDMLFGGGVICDDKEAIIILGRDGEMMAIWSNHSELIYIAKHYFNSLWHSAKA